MQVNQNSLSFTTSNKRLQYANSARNELKIDFIGVATMNVEPKADARRDQSQRFMIDDKRLKMKMAALSQV